MKELYLILIHTMKKRLKLLLLFRWGWKPTWATLQKA